jgi:hypothetical protein
MTFWDILGLTPTDDEQAIKKAYRMKLRQHHPEEDPDGFRQVREAYESVLHHLQQSATVKNEPSPTHSQEPIQGQKSPTDETTSQQAINTLQILLANPRQRFQLDQWQTWVDQVQQHAITEQEEISDKAVHLVLSNRWLPGGIIDKLWTGLGWEMLLKGTEEQVELGEFLNTWRYQSLCLPLHELSRLSHAEQRAILNFLRPFQTAFENGWLDAINYLFTQPSTWICIRSTEFAFNLLRVFMSCPAITRAIAQDYLAILLKKEDQALTTEQWHLLAEICLRLERKEDVYRICQILLSRQAYAEVAVIQFERTIENDTDLALGFAFLQQQWAPLPVIFWRTERRLLREFSDRHASDRFFWLYNQLLGNRHQSFNHPLDFRNQSGLTGTLLKCFWGGKYGSWSWITNHLEILRTAALSATSEWQILIRLTTIWLNEILDTRPGCPSLLDKFAAYGQDKFLEQTPLTENELTSMTEQAWLTTLCRHPLIPDSWFKQLFSANYINLDKLQAFHHWPYYIENLYYYRCVNPDYQLTSPWQGQEFPGQFDWATAFYGQLVTSFEPDNAGLLEILPPLPQTLPDCALTCLLPFLNKPDCYLKKEVDAFRHYPEQFVFRYVTYAQVQLLKRKYDQQELVALALERHITAYAALSELSTPEHLEAAIIYWNLLLIAAKNQPHYSAVIHWQQEELQQIRKKQSLEKEFYEFAKPEMVYWMITTESDAYENPATIAAVKPVKEAEHFHFPIFFLLTQLHHGTAKTAYNLEPLKAFSEFRHLQTEPQQQVTDVALSELEHMYQQHLDEELTSGTIQSYSKNGLRGACLLMIVSWILIPFMAVAGKHASVDTTWIGLGMLSFFVASQALLTGMIARYIPRKRGRIKYITGICASLLIAAVMQTFLILGVNLYLHFSMISRLPGLYINGRWEKKIVKMRKINLRRILGFK